MRKVLIFSLILVIISAGFFSAWLFLIKKTAASQDVIQFKEVKLEQSPTIEFSDWEKQRLEELEEKIQQQKQQLTLFVAGDIMMSRAVEKKMIAKEDFTYCLSKMTPKIQEADIAFANLESPIIEGSPVADGSFSFRAHPKSAESLKAAGFDIVSLANNHFGNQGQNGMEKTFDYLTQQGIEYVGAGDSSSQMKNPVIIEKNNIKVAFLAYAYGPDYYEAETNKAGMALMKTEQLINDLQIAKAQADVVVVSMHDGVEYVNEPSVHQEEFAHTAIDNGADLVIGHHPHVVQQMEIYQEKYIFYSLGNFVFDQMWSQNTRHGLSILFTITKKGVVDLKYYPVVIEDYCRPVLANDEIRDEIINKL